MKKTFLLLLLPLFVFGQTKIDYLRDPDQIRTTDTMPDGTIRVIYEPTADLTAEFNRRIEVSEKELEDINVQLAALNERKKKLEAIISRLIYLRNAQ